MTEAKAMKLKEYYTTVTSHTHLEPTDMSGEDFIHLKRCDSVRSKSRGATSPIRMNDTYRSTLTLGEERTD